jgi:hypothetical protein
VTLVGRVGFSSVRTTTLRLQHFSLLQDPTLTLSEPYEGQGVKMVRIKHRYLLINILYPACQATQLRVALGGLPDVVHFHQPTPTNFGHDMLRRLIRDGVTELFGDYGAGMIAGSLKGTCAIIPIITGGLLSHEPSPPCALAQTLTDLVFESHVSFYGHIDCNHSRVSGELSACLGCAVICDKASQSLKYAVRYPSIEGLRYCQEERGSSYSVCH